MKNKSNIYNLILIVTSLLIELLVYNKLPDLVPVHWNVSGEIDGYGPKIVGAFLTPVIMIFTWGGMKFLPKIDPRKRNYEKFEKSYSIIVNMLITFFFVVHIVTLGTALGYNIPVGMIVPIIVGLLFVVIGNYMPKLKSNFFIGIKTPWTLSSEFSWRKTHRLSSKLFVAAGIVIIISGFISNAYIKIAAFIISLSVIAIVPLAASYFYAEKENNN